MDDRWILWTGVVLLFTAVVTLVYLALNYFFGGEIDG